jgi:hypothetical protein
MRRCAKSHSPIPVLVYWGVVGLAQVVVLGLREPTKEVTPPPILVQNLGRGVTTEFHRALPHARHQRAAQSAFCIYGRRRAFKRPAVGI